VESTDAIHWSQPVKAKNSDGSDLKADSFDVKFDPATNSLVMYDIVGDHTELSHLVCRYSTDGVNWSPPEVICDPFAFPNYAHNVGVSSDEYGIILPDEVIVAYGVPHTDDADATFQTTDISWASWDLCAHLIGGSFQGPVGYFANSNATWYSDGPTYCGLMSPAHFQMHRMETDRPLIGLLSRSRVGVCTGICSIPAGYFSYGTAFHYSQGNGTYVSFASPETLKRHSAQHPNPLNFGWLQSDPATFMRWAGIWQG
jgi:hypothetical protein